MTIYRWNGSNYVNLSSGDVQPVTDAQFRPRSYATVAEARTAEGAPADANYVVWSHGTTDLETVFASLSENDILVLPERADAFGVAIPYTINSANGFMAAGVKEVDGTGANGMKDGSRVPIVSNNRLWFAMTRARRGILGMGPKTVIIPTNSGYTAPKQPILQNEATNNRFQLRYMLDGTTAEMVGVQNKLIECEHVNSFFANFVLQGRSFGGTAYNGLAITLPTGGTTKISHIFFDGCWRGHSGVPNGETGGLTFQKGFYAINGIDLRSEGGPSPIMWNRTQGGTAHNVRSQPPNYGMFTYWRCSGNNVLTEVYEYGTQIGLNLEENENSFDIDWTGGAMTLNYPISNNRFHLNINPSGGSIGVRLKGVEISPNAYTPNTMSAHIYTTPNTQLMADVTCDTRPVSYLNGAPGTGWL